MATRLDIKNTFAPTNPNSDASLILDAILYDDSFFPGNRRAAKLLLSIAPQHRIEARMEGQRLCNSAPGWRPSDALAAACMKYQK